MGAIEDARARASFSGNAGDVIARAMRRRCPECERVFDLMEETDCAEWFYGHDCEVDA